MLSQCKINKGIPSITTTNKEVEQFLGVLLKMCIIQAPYYRYYWETATRYEPISNVMSRNRFESLKRFLHFNDNDNALPPNDEKRDRLFKIRPIFEKLRQNCITQTPEEYNSLDEQMIKGRSFLRRNMLKKPYKWGF